MTMTILKSPKLLHLPIRPTRQVMEEQVFARRWAELMLAPPIDEWSCGQISYVLRTYPYPIDQRAAAVAASMVVWFGTSVGKSFLDLGAKLRKSMPELNSMAYAAAWGVRNSRVASAMQRQIQFLTRTQEEMEKDNFPEVTIQDMEVMEQVALWLGTDDGQDFLTKAEAEIDRRKDLERIAFQCAAGNQNLPETQKLMDKFAIRD